MRRVLMINYHFPPLVGMGSLRALKFSTYLPEFGWMPVTIAPREGGCEQDPSLSSAGLHVHRTRHFQPGRGVKRVLRTVASASVHSNRVVGRIQNLIRRWLYYPDGQIGWYPFAVAAARRAIRADHFDVIFSSSFPITAHLVARRLHRDTGIPWVAEFRDLWTEWGNESPKRQRLDESIERSIFTEATAVVTVSSTYGNVLRSRGARHVSILTNGFDPVDFSEAICSDGTTAAYVGTYYPEYQDLGTALRALGDLARSGSISECQLRFVGNMPSGLDRTFAESGVTDLVQCTGFVPHREALRYMCEAKVLLLSGPISTARDALRGHIPGKTFEYLGSGRSILFVGDASSDVAALLGPLASVRIVAPGNVEGARGALLSLLRGSETPTPAQLEHFTSRSLTKGLAETLDSACH